ncbi:MAG: GNAT family N-acetyltransferase [Hyphomicrobiaceae bacterium]
MTGVANLIVRDLAERDFAAAHALNESVVPAVNSLSPGGLRRLASLSVAALVAEYRGEVAGLALVMLEGLDYESDNYAWLSARYNDFAYVDRIAVSETARGLGIGRTLYAEVFERLSGLRETLLCEVNLAPANPTSVAFHTAFGFRQIGERWTQDRSKGVVYMARPVHPPPSIRK